MADTLLLKSDDSPIIGILCVDIAIKLKEKYGVQFTSYLAASYVKFVEGGGARVVPIWIGRDRAYYERMLKSLNGVLLPGGAVYFFEKNGFADAGRHIYDIATEMNKEGIHFPIFGICLGFELLLYAGTGGVELRQDCDSTGISMALNFSDGAGKSRLFGSAPEEIMKIFSLEKNSYNYHKYCITENDLRDKKIDKEWSILSTNSDSKVENYISSIEHVRYPFYGLQFHPERNEYEHKSEKIIHTQNAIKCSRYLVNFFVSEARKNENCFTENQSRRHLINNYAPEPINSMEIPWEACYLFEQNIDYPTDV